MSDVVLSIIIPTYGHEKYIGQALDSVLMQKTKYKYEVLVGEDASPDGTRAILKDYEKKYPGIFTMIYRDVNAGGFGKGNFLDLVRRTKGRYLAILEGDDYWISDDKIEKQVNFLEEHSEYVAVSCNTIVVDAESKETGENYPECKDEEYTIKHLQKNILQGQTACNMYRTNIIKEIMADEIWNTKLPMGDRIITLGIVAKGKVYCIQKPMSAYRHITEGGFGYSATQERGLGLDECIEFLLNLIGFTRRLKNKKAEILIERLYLAILFGGMVSHDISICEFVRLFLNIKHKIIVPCIKIKDFTKRNILIRKKYLI